MRSRRGFSLLEAMIVVCILGLLASGTMLVLSGPMQRAKHQAVLAELAVLDQWARVHSKRGAVELHFDLNAQAVEAVAQSRVNERKYVQLPPGLRILEILTGGIACDSGVAEVGYAAGGCPTHALLIQMRTGQSGWTIISGPTGQRYAVKSDEAAEKQLRAWFAHWTHPD